jgi:hypothetical protein
MQSINVERMVLDSQPKQQDVKQLNALLRNATGASSTLADHLQCTIQNDSWQPISGDKDDMHWWSFSKALEVKSVVK